MIRLGILITRITSIALYLVFIMHIILSYDIIGVLLQVKLSKNA